ncbi:MAG: NAD(P)-dependent glycerol-3-phosphate dehydrogenase [candidate division NC10 bacterium]|nr:NAD(P)-dependent glycerol-3-phosphate dehydrogenase [candidate division NC10 bacterium]
MMLPVASEAPRTVAVVGAGAWGTTLATILGDRYPRVNLWVFEADLAEAIQCRRENGVYLPGVRIPDPVRATSSLAEALTDVGLVLFVVPSHVFRRIASAAAAHLPSKALVASATKGIEVETLATMSEILAEVLPPLDRARLAVLSGPSFAQEVARRRPTAVVAAARDPSVAGALQRAVSGGSFRVYAGLDPLGVELGGAVKNVIAIAAGIVDGLELGLNARAALITRGLAEMSRLGVAKGAQPATFAGLAGMGDLILTATGDLSRNRRLGMAIAGGRRLEEILAGSKSVAEGVNTCRSVVRLAERLGVEMPISRAVHRVLFEGQAPREAVVQLMTRELRFEGE